MPGYTAGLTAAILTAIAAKDGYASKHQLTFLMMFLMLVLAIFLSELYPAVSQLNTLAHLLTLPAAASIPATVNRSRPSEIGTFVMKILYGIIPGMVGAIVLLSAKIHEPMTYGYLFFCVTTAMVMMKKLPKSTISPQIFGKWIFRATVTLVPLIFLIDIYGEKIFGARFIPGFYVLPIFYGILNSLFIADLMKRFTLRFESSVPQNHIEQFPLSNREKEVAKLLLEGLTYGKIAEQLNISHSTVKSHCSNIYEKMKVTNRSELYHLTTHRIVSTVAPEQA